MNTIHDLTCRKCRHRVWLATKRENTCSKADYRVVDKPLPDWCPARLWWLDKFQGLVAKHNLTNVPMVA